MLTPITPAQQAYISTIERCSASSPELLIAHAYVRYMADLSGGQILSRRLQKYNGIPEGKGVAFYHFELIEQPEVFKDMFRKRLNQVEISDDQRQEIIQETIMAFHRNIDIFQEFDSELEGLPMTRLEQLENLEELEKEKARLAAEAKAAKDVANLDTPKSGFLTSLNPANLWNSLVGA
ncbi:hypothetical protein BGZ46_004870 [Entomortierella lignicola]|nr:hypothetical protein BGZ46_004870 [Entomortierella lignicola]